MATYKEIKGVTLQTLDEDPVVNAGSWSSGGSMNTARTAKQSSGTGSDNAIVAGGYLATASPARQTACEVYNGTAWTEVAEANTARMFGQGGGTSTAAVEVPFDAPFCLAVFTSFNSVQLVPSYFSVLAL